MIRHPWFVGVWIITGLAIGIQSAAVRGQAEADTHAPAVPSPSVPGTMPPADSIVPIPGITDRDNTAAGLLGEPFEGKTAGITFRPPAGSKTIENPGSDDIANYKVENRSWMLNIRRLVPETRMPLSSYRDPVDKGHSLRQGLIESTIKQLTDANPGAKLIRQDEFTIGAQYAGLVVMRFTLGTQNWLRQQLIVRVNDKLYYVFSFTTPSDNKVAPAEVATTKATTEPEEEAAGPLDTQAVAVFRAMLETIKVLDLSPVRAEQVERLFRTRSLLVDWTKKRFEELLIPQQYFRVVRIETNKDGVQIRKDIGWSYVEEMTGGQRRALEAMHKNDPNPLPRDRFIDENGLVVYTRSFLKLDATKLQTSSENFVTFDRNREAWALASLTTGQDKAGKDFVQSHTTEFGESTRREHIYFARPGDTPGTGVRDANDIKGPATRPIIEHALDVTMVGKSGTKPPIHRDLPEWYLPQALGSLLPRAVLPPLRKRLTLPAGDAADMVLPSQEGRTYQFCSYVSSIGEVMERYVDVSRMRTINFNGQTFFGLTVSDRLGLEGAPTIHYFNENGQYMGAEARASNLLIIPSTHDGITAIWPDAVLAKPDYFERKSPE